MMYNYNGNCDVIVMGTATVMDNGGGYCSDRGSNCNRNSDCNYNANAIIMQR